MNRRTFLKQTATAAVAAGLGEGAADCANCLKEIHSLGYRALVTIDFEHDTPQLQEDMAKNIAFIEEQARTLMAQ